MNKLRIMLKDPDGVGDSVSEFIAEEGLDDDAAENLAEQLEAWIEADEYIQVEFDLDNGTARVIPTSEWWQ